MTPARTVIACETGCLRRPHIYKTNNVPPGRYREVFSSRSQRPVPKLKGRYLNQRETLKN